MWIGIQDRRLHGRRHPASGVFRCIVFHIVQLSMRVKGIKTKFEFAVNVYLGSPGLF
jgi:hypothetical protein